MTCTMESSSRLDWSWLARRMRPRSSSSSPRSDLPRFFARNAIRSLVRHDPTGSVPASVLRGTSGGHGSPVHARAGCVDRLGGGLEEKAGSARGVLPELEDPARLVRSGALPVPLPAQARHAAHELC